MEGELRRLGEGADKHPCEDRDDRRAPRELGRPRDHVGQRIGAQRHADEEDGGQQRKAAAGGDMQRHQRRSPRGGTVNVEADEQEREQARRLPEEEQDDQVVGQHGAQHRRHEEQDQGEEPGPVRRRALDEVGVGVDHDERADAGYEQAEEVGEAVQSQCELDTERRRPGDPLGNDPSRLDRGAEAQEADEEAHGHEREQPAHSSAAEKPTERQRHTASDRRGGEQDRDHTSPKDGILGVVG